MRKPLIVRGVRDGAVVDFPPDLDAIDIVTEIGVIHIDLGQQIPNMVLVRSSDHTGGPGSTRLILSPLESGRLAFGVIKA
jgi:hypothetical protein